MSSFVRYNIIYKLRAWMLDCFRKTFESIGFLRCITEWGFIEPTRDMHRHSPYGMWFVNHYSFLLDVLIP